jgi:hypothetical protein
VHRVKVGHLKTFVIRERAGAVQAGVLWPKASGRSGRASDVLTEEENSALLLVWEVGRDAYSPLA